jgi:hypothetical protein
MGIFVGFRRVWSMARQAVETAPGQPSRRHTSLKRGVNERANGFQWLKAKSLRAVFDHSFHFSFALNFRFRLAIA